MRFWRWRLQRRWMYPVFRFRKRRCGKGFWTAQHRHMIHTDRGNDRADRCFNQIGRIRQTAESGLQYDELFKRNKRVCGMTYQEAMEYVESLKRYGCVPGLSSIRQLCMRLGNPQDKLKFVKRQKLHIPRLCLYRYYFSGGICVRHSVA